MPQRTLQLLDQLEEIGFTNDDFRVLHHFGDGSSISVMRNYCHSVATFRAGSPNELLCRRLEHVLRSFQRGNFSSPAKPGVFRGLCKDALREIAR